MTPGTTATVNVVDAAGACSPGATLGITPTQLTVYVFAEQVPVNPAKRVVSVTLPEIGYYVAPSVTAMHLFSLALGS